MDGMGVAGMIITSDDWDHSRNFPAFSTSKIQQVVHHEFWIPCPNKGPTATPMAYQKKTADLPRLQRQRGGQEAEAPGAPGQGEAAEAPWPQRGAAAVGDRLIKMTRK